MGLPCPKEQTLPLCSLVWDGSSCFLSFAEMSKRLPKQKAAGQLTLDYFRPQKQVTEVVNVADDSNSGTTGSPPTATVTVDVLVTDTEADDLTESDGDANSDSANSSSGDERDESGSSSSASSESDAGSCTQTGLDTTTPWSDDIACYLDRLPLSNEDARQIVKSHFTPPESFQFPRTEMNGRNRSFQLSWLKTYPWLVYSKSQDGGYCLPCVLFSSPTAANRGVLVKTPFKR